MARSMATNLKDKLQLPIEAIAGFCRKHDIRRLAIFGSALTDGFRPDSDVDVLVEFEPEKTPGFALVSVEDELSGLLRRTVDLITVASLKPRIRSRVVSQAELVYSAE